MVVSGKSSLLWTQVGVSQFDPNTLESGHSRERTSGGMLVSCLWKTETDVSLTHGKCFMS